MVFKITPPVLFERVVFHLVKDLAVIDCLQLVELLFELLRTYSLGWVDGLQCRVDNWIENLGFLNRTKWSTHWIRRSWLWLVR